MFASIKTSRSNRDVITSLTQKLNLGAENIIARIAFSVSIARGDKLDLKRIEDSQGKEYSAKVLFGNYLEIYVGLLATHYGVNKSDKDIPKYVKMHIDQGLAIISSEITLKRTITGNDFLINEIEKGLARAQFS